MADGADGGGSGWLAMLLPWPSGMGAKFGSLPFAAAVACISRFSSEMPRLLTRDAGSALDDENEAARSTPGKRSERLVFACRLGSGGGSGSSEDEAGNAEADGKPAVPNAAWTVALLGEGANTPGGRENGRLPEAEDVADEGGWGE